MLSSTIKVSARLVTVLALCKYAALIEPPGNTKELRLERGLLNLSIAVSSLLTWFSVILKGGNLGDLDIGVARSAPRSNKSFCISETILISFLET